VRCGGHGDAKIPGAEVVECKPLAKKQAVSWIVAEFRLHGVRCDLEVAEQLLDLCDGDFGLLTPRLKSCLW